MTADWPHPVPPIAPAEYAQRLERLRTLMQASGVEAVLLGASESMRYFTGLVWHPSERLLGALVLPTRLVYIVPGFERSRVETLPHVAGDIATWEEHEDAAALVASLAGPAGKVALDDTLPLFAFYPLAAALGAERIVEGAPLLRSLRLRKSAAEIAIIRHAMGLTLEVHRRAHALMKPGIRASEAVRFIDEQHRALGAPEGSSFCIVSFGKATALPHGADGEQTLHAGDVILVDTGCRIDGYHSDLTRTYTLDEPTPDVARIWALERAAQEAVFAAARIGAAAEALDAAARRVIEAGGLGPGYRLPGLPHRAGHGLGLDIHEPPYIVRGNRMALEAGMCFSVEPMIVVPGAFGIRLEDHICMTEDGPDWFTEPAKSPTEPFASP
ncbi:Xaa-Pro dipeptidase [Pseudochelatococcus lubricantis]|uniref:Xaa-Pro dipeptidase n=1 Tax=Pseudochelatococcus lubricantis TaxID=1538102 RepID=A0ABX0UZE1_9HYPH|nr:Xaa-Pro peptidase family protein [Pseudochelatococcus lubricantis]NIJ58268.1 Xaa-Pro dipeptidase [Pseudochelatococcus lubricantis]